MVELLGDVTRGLESTLFVKEILKKAHPKTNKVLKMFQQGVVLCATGT